MYSVSSFVRSLFRYLVICYVFRSFVLSFLLSLGLPLFSYFVLVLSCVRLFRLLFISVRLLVFVSVWFSLFSYLFRSFVSYFLLASVVI